MAVELNHLLRLFQERVRNPPSAEHQVLAALPSRYIGTGERCEPCGVV